MDEQIDKRDEVPTLSLVVPLLNEEEALEETYRRLTETMRKIGESYELVFVDDGSTDSSRSLLTQKSKSDSHVRIVGLSRNFGHELATTAGLSYARGKAAVIIDADLQDPPEVIKEFLEKWKAGYDVVYGVRHSREGETALKKMTSFLFYRLMGKIADVPIPPDTGDFRLIDRKVIDVFQRLGEDPRFFRGLISWIGFKQTGVPFQRQPRIAGKSKYRFTRLFRLAFDTITAFSTLPSLVITFLASAAAGISSLFILGVILYWISGNLEMDVWKWAFLGGLLLWNVQFLSLAMLGEYLVRTHRHSQCRPLFVVDQFIENGTPQ